MQDDFNVKNLITQNGKSDGERYQEHEGNAGLLRDNWVSN